MEISLKFDERSKDNLKKVNAAIRNLWAESLDITDIKGFLADETEHAPDGEILYKQKWFGIDEISITLVEKGDRFKFKLDAIVMEAEKDISIEQFHDRWLAENTHASLRLIHKIEYSDASVFVIAYHAKGPGYVI